MTFETKFDLGQKIYPLIREIVPKPCQTCDNGKLLLADGRRLTCHDCHGSGTINGSVKKVLWGVGPEAVVNSVVMSAPAVRPCEAYQFGGSREWDVKDVFATKESAEVECEKRNEAPQG